jgi:hypothetical protein
MTTRTILIKRNADKNYDRLFKVIEQSTIMGRVNSISEKETPGGYAVELPYIGQEVLELVESRPKDFEVL